MNVVIDTNILVSALISPNGSPAKILDMMLNGMITICYDSRILAEYEAVLARPKFKIDTSDLKVLVNFIRAVGISVVPLPVMLDFIDEDDKKFYEVATHCHAKLITGNVKHFPVDEIIITAAGFLNKYQ